MIYRTKVQHPTDPEQFLMVYSTKATTAKEVGRKLAKLGYDVPETAEPVADFDDSDEAVSTVKHLMPL